MDFSFHTAGEIIFGVGKIRKLSDVASAFGRKAIICARGEHLFRSGVLDLLVADFHAKQAEVHIFKLPDGEPNAVDVNHGAEAAKKCAADVIIAIGGGSCIDTGKAIAGMATNPGVVADYLEGIGNCSLRLPGLPCIAVPTTAGTGAEVTKNAVITSPEHKAKKSIRSPLLLPRIALLDPQLTFTLPPRITAETGMDALTQLIESYVSLKAQPIPQTLALQGICLAGKYLYRAFIEGSDQEAREGMMLASLLSGMALANSGLGAAHGIAAALGALANIPHGRACAMLLSHVMRANRTDCTKSFAEIHFALTGEILKNESLAAIKAIEFVEILVQHLGIPEKFSSLEVDSNLVPELVRDSQGSSMKGNPRVLSEQEIEGIIRKLIHPE